MYGKKTLKKKKKSKIVWERWPETKSTGPSSK